ncbi:MAG: hypothetical protein R3F20_06100 [Planctomycetota bacterium]
MSREETYASIIEAAIAEHPELRAVRRGSVAYTDAADALADSLYRLCIEFGASFNEFKRDVLALVPQRREQAEGGEESAPAHPIVRGLGRHAELVILALELMRDDSTF